MYVSLQNYCTQQQKLLKGNRNQPLQTQLQNRPACEGTWDATPLIFTVAGFHCHTVCLLFHSPFLLNSLTFLFYFLKNIFIYVLLAKINSPPILLKCTVTKIINRTILNCSRMQPSDFFSTHCWNNYTSLLYTVFFHCIHET